MAEDIPDTQIPSQLHEYTDSEDDNNNASKNSSENNSDAEETTKTTENHSDNSSDNDSDGSDEDLFGDDSDKESDIDSDSEDNKKRHSKLVREDQIAPPKKKANIDTETSILTEIEDAEKIDLVNHQLPPKEHNAFIIQFPPSIDIQKNVYDPQKYEMKDPQKFLRHTIRWRRTPGNKATRESNTNLVRWSDGTFTLNIGGTTVSLGKSELPGFNLFGIKSNGRIEAHTTVKRKLRVYNPPDVLESTVAKSRTSFAKLVEEAYNESSSRMGFETTTEEARSKKTYGKGKSSLGSALGGDEYDNDINDTLDDKRAAASIRDAKKSKKKQRK